MPLKPIWPMDIYEPADFDAVIQSVSGIGIPLDFGFGGGPSPSEMVL
ncbi:MAG: hypothetical protein IPH31_01555 [Lewinellaceae bacterium]|nr:hypothetical protein [Lewinellaceae bacterium]